MGVNVWEAFAGQSWEEVRGALVGLGKEGVRERVGRKRILAALEGVMEILRQQDGDLREMLEGWAGEEELLELSLSP